MKLGARDIDRFLAQPPDTVFLALIFGPDQGLVKERADRLARAVVPDSRDPFRICTLSEDELKSDPARLGDEFSAIAMGGGRRVIRVRIKGAEATRHVVAFVTAHEKGGFAGDALVIVEGGDLKPGSSLRKCAERKSAATVAAIPCYRDSFQDVKTLIHQTLSAEHLTIAPDVADLLAAQLGGDRGTTRNELDKLVLYKRGGGGAGDQITEEDIHAIIADAAALDRQDVALAAASGQQKALASSLDRCFSEGETAVSILRTLAAHMERLLLCRAAMDKGASLKAALDTLRPAVHFRVRSRFEQQVRLWTCRDIARALTRLYETETACKTTGQPSEVLCRDVAVLIARHAARCARRQSRSAPV